MKVSAVLAIFIFLLSKSGNAQVVSYFGVQQVDNTVVLQFTITRGNTCNGIDIFRARDSINYSLVGDIQGVCGNTATDESYTFTDNSPLLNSDNYYRLDMKQLGITASVYIRVFDQSSKSLSLFPNPAETNTSIYFSPESAHKATVMIFNMIGKTVLESIAIDQVPYLINTSNFEAGIYMVRVITDDKKNLVSKLIVR